MSPAGALRKGLAELGIGCPDETLSAFALYAAELMKWSRAYNLTAIRDEAGIYGKHFLDSAIYLAAIGPGVGSVADVGSGAGFPGIVMKLLRPNLGMTLIEPTGKKAAFLRNISRKLGLDMDIIESPVEKAPAIAAHAAVTRALFSAAEFVRKADHIVAPGGLFVLSKGPKAGDELGALDSMGADCRAMEIKVSGLARTLIIVRKG